jgi:DNA mismatch endonuclease (patch repair protein)
MDIFDSKKRSRIMSHIKGKNTKPELIVRSLLHNMGYRYRLHRKDLPGKPDIVLPKYRKIIFIHGCFWHGHRDCSREKRPSSNQSFWNEKLDKNLRRDRQHLVTLKEAGWDVLVIWTCEVKQLDRLKEILQDFLE